MVLTGGCRLPSMNELQKSINNLWYDSTFITIQTCLLYETRTDLQTDEQLLSAGSYLRQNVVVCKKPPMVAGEPLASRYPFNSHQLEVDRFHNCILGGVSDVKAVKPTFWSESGIPIQVIITCGIPCEFGFRSFPRDFPQVVNSVRNTSHFCHLIGKDKYHKHSTRSKKKPMVQITSTQYVIW